MKSTHVCRCCLSEACYKDISNDYYHAGEKEVYSDIIFDTFNLTISYQEDGKRLICEDCVIKLRSAAAFRKQIIHAEEFILKNLVSDGVDIDADSELLPKFEINQKDDFIDHITEAFDEMTDDDCYNDDYRWQDEDIVKHEDTGDLFIIKLEPKEESTEKKGHKISTRKLLKSSIKCIDSNTDLDSENIEEIVKSVKHNKTGHAPKRKALKTETEKASKKQIKTKSRKLNVIPNLEVKENSLKLITNSNLCLFESLKTRFRCFYCKETFMHITELREHAETHSNPKYLKKCINRMQGMSFKTVDISSLACKLCSEGIKDLDDLRNHLNEQHNIEFSNGDHLLVPYRLENGFNCVLCQEKFNTYFRLSIHMNTHFMNNVCEICGVSYINRLSLRMHVKSLHQEKKCTLCSATFQTNYSRIKHMRKVHNFMASKRYCLVCNKTFPYTYLLAEHMIQDHGAKRPISKCVECGKSFLTPQNLKIHMRSVHIRERNHPCSYCGMRFFTKCDQRRHERTHEDVRSFACSYCEGRFKSKDSMRRHLRRQHSHLFVSDRPV